VPVIKSLVPDNTRRPVAGVAWQRVIRPGEFAVSVTRLPAWSVAEAIENTGGPATVMSALPDLPLAVARTSATPGVAEVNRTDAAAIPLPSPVSVTSDEASIPAVVVRDTVAPSASLLAVTSRSALTGAVAGRKVWPFG
jgi:hypothetical protein